MSIANDSPFVSIGLMVHNAEDWLEKTIRSLLDQTHTNFELIISDNASRDNSGGICTEFALKDERITYYRNEVDIGSFRNSMKVFNIARGEFFMWAGDHDLWAPTFISKCLDILMKDESVALSYPQTILIDADDTPISVMTDKIDTRGISPIEAYRKILWELESCNMFYGIFRTAVLRKLLPASMTIGTDVILLGRLSLVGAIAQTREPLFLRRQNRNPESIKESTARWVEILIQDRSKLEAKAPWLMMCNSHLENIRSCALTDTEKMFMISEVVASCTTRFGGSIKSEYDTMLDIAILLLQKNPVEQNIVECLDLARFIHIIRMFYPELEGIDFLLGTVFFMNGLLEEAEYFAKREKAKYPRSRLAEHLIDALGGVNVCLVRMASTYIAQKDSNTSHYQVAGQHVVRLYAGDVPDQPEYEGWLGLSLTQSDHRHLLQDITKALPFPDNSVDAFQAEDVLEHIPYDRLVPVINEIFRVLKPGALFRLSVPDYGCDVLRERSIKSPDGDIIFDPGGGGTRENPGHVWFPTVESVHRLLEATRFFTDGSMDFLHYWNVGRPGFVTRPIDYSKGFVKRTPDHDERVKNPYRPMSVVVDLYKGA